MRKGRGCKEGRKEQKEGEEGTEKDREEEKYDSHWGIALHIFIN